MFGKIDGTLAEFGKKHLAGRFQASRLPWENQGVLPPPGGGRQNCDRKKRCLAIERDVRIIFYFQPFQKQHQQSTAHTQFCILFRVYMCSYVCLLLYV